MHVSPIPMKCRSFVCGLTLQKGSDKFYRLPDIAIKVIRVREYEAAMPKAISHVKERHGTASGPKPATHLLVTSKEAVQAG